MDLTTADLSVRPNIGADFAQSQPGDERNVAGALNGNLITPVGDALARDAKLASKLRRRARRLDDAL